MENNKKYNFKENVFIAFEVEDVYCIGFTILDTKGDKVVNLVGNNGKTGKIRFDEIENPRVLNILGTFDGKKKPMSPPPSLHEGNTSIEQMVKSIERLHVINLN
jgi:hypothetical protein